MSEQEQLEQAIAALEAQRALLGEAVVETALAPLRAKLAALNTPPAEQRKQVTVLFADVSGFTAFAERRDPEEVRDTMNALWAALDAVLVRHGGLIDKHIGDAVMALFGAGTAQEEDPAQAVLAALAMQVALRAFAAARPGAPVLQLRIGVHTGPVLLGAVGSTGEYTALGDTVNLASRLEQAAPVGGVLISHSTYRQAQGLFEIEAQAPLQVKGKTEPVQTYVVRAARPHAFHIANRGVEGVTTPLVGRAAELAALQAALHEAIAAHDSRAVTVVGDAGVGKSRLLDEFIAWVEQQPDEIWFFKGRADPQRSHLPYALIRDLLAYRFTILDSDEAAVARRKLEEGVAGFLGAAGRPTAHFLGHLIGLDFSASPYLRGIRNDTRQIHARAFQYATQFFTAVAAQGPTLLCLEDLHWADEGSLALLDHLARTCRGAPLCSVGLARPGLVQRVPGWGTTWPRHTRLDLRPLADATSRELVAAILRRVTDLPPALSDLIVQRAEGNPLYVEELIKMLIEDGVIVPGPDQWRVTRDRLATVRVPPTLTGILQARLDRLPPAEQATLQQAAVVGRVFWDEAVDRLQQLAAPAGGSFAASAPPPAPALAALQQKELVFGSADTAFQGTREYLFKHAILHDVTYESVLLRRRRVYHAAVAAWLEQRSGDRAAEYAGVIGEHYERAGDQERAARWYARAGQQAAATYAPEAAITYYQQALAFLPTDPAHRAQRMAVYEELGELLLGQARFAESATTYETMRTLAEEAGDLTAQARAWNALCRTQDHRGEYRAALDSAIRAEAVARAAGADDLRARALHERGWVLTRLGEAEEALALGEEALRLATDLQVPYVLRRSRLVLCSAYLSLGQYDAAIRYGQEALALFREDDNRLLISGSLNNLGEIERTRGDYEAALPLYQEALALAREIGNRDAEMVYLSNLGGTRAALGEYAAAEPDLRQAIVMAEASEVIFPEVYCFLAQTLLGQGRLAEALVAAQQALTRAEAEQESVAAIWRVLGQIAARLPTPPVIGGTPYPPAACFAASLRAVPVAEREGERARTLRAWAVYELAQGDPAHGTMLRQEAQAEFARLGMPLELARMPAAPTPGAQGRAKGANDPLDKTR